MQSAIERQKEREEKKMYERPARVDATKQLHLWDKVAVISQK